MNDELLRMHLARAEGVLILRLSGEIDLSNAEHVQRELEGATSRSHRVVVDLTDIEYLDSQGLRLIKQICNKADREGTKITLIAPPKSVARQVLDLAQMSEYVEILDAPSD